MTQHNAFCADSAHPQTRFHSGVQFGAFSKAFLKAATFGVLVAGVVAPVSAQALEASSGYDTTRKALEIIQAGEPLGQAVGFSRETETVPGAESALGCQHLLMRDTVAGSHRVDYGVATTGRLDDMAYEKKSGLSMVVGLTVAFGATAKGGADEPRLGIWHSQSQPSRSLAVQDYRACQSAQAYDAAHDGVTRSIRNLLAVDVE